MPASNSTRRHLWLALAALTALYVGAYVSYRNANSEIWTGDGHTYVLFDSAMAYYAFRPLSYVDGALTGMRCHIGPNR